MKVTIHWLKDFVPLAKSPEAIAQALTLAGLPVASIENKTKAWDGIVVGKILKIEKHPQADRLTLCQVDVGREVLRIVCGAANAKEQDLVPVATVGATLPGPVRIEKAKIRGELSLGMMCSKRELGMGEDHEGLFILNTRVPLGTPLSRALGLDDTVLDVEVTPNRPDCLSALGIAREISAITNVAMKKRPTPQGNSSKTKPWDIALEAREHCWMYCGCLLEDVRVGPSPEWLKRRLESVGLRSINNVVDITNYVLLTFGQPLHAFDADTLTGNKIHVRLARPAEKLTTIDGVQRDLTSQMLVIADDEKPVALAGIMGGSQTEITLRSTKVFLESALFNPVTVRRASRGLGLASDSSYRFERGVDPEGVQASMKEAIAMLVNIAGAKPGPIRKVVSRNFPQKKISVQTSEISKLLGMNVGAPDFCRFMRRLNFGTAKAGSGKITVRVPSYRLDVQETADLVEEYARLRGYDKIPLRVPHPAGAAPQEPNEEETVLRRTLAAQGFDETVHLSFMSERRYQQLRRIAHWEFALVEMDNPLDQDQRFLRPTLSDALMSTIALNQNRGAQRCLIFEMGKVFQLVSGKAQERKMLGIAATGAFPFVQWQGKDRPFDFFDLKGTVEAVLETLHVPTAAFRPLQEASLYQPGQACKIVCGEKILGTFGKVHPDVAALYELRGETFLCELDVLDLLHYSGKSATESKSVSRFPSIVRDIAIVLDKGIPLAAVQQFLESFCGPVLEGVSFFDLFEGKNIPAGKKSLAFRLCYRSGERTLTEAEVGPVHAGIVEALRSKWNCELREAQPA